MPLEYDHIPEIIAKISEGCETAVERTGFEFEREAKARARVRFGFMRNNIRFYMGKEVDSVAWEKDDKTGTYSFRITGLKDAGTLTGVIIGGASYTIYNEYGTIYMSAQPMFWPAAEVVRPRFQSEIQNVVRRAVEG